MNSNSVEADSLMHNISTTAASGHEGVIGIGRVSEQGERTLDQKQGQRRNHSDQKLRHP
jgi:hypothetical protein